MKRWTARSRRSYGFTCSRVSSRGKLRAASPPDSMGPNSSWPPASYGLASNAADAVGLPGRGPVLCSQGPTAEGQPGKLSWRPAQSHLSRADRPGPVGDSKHACQDGRTTTFLWGCQTYPEKAHLQNSGLRSCPVCELASSGETSCIGRLHPGSQLACAKPPQPCWYSWP